MGAALESHEKTNCVTMFIVESINRAVELDEMLKQSSFQMTPIFGIPVSIKECCKVSHIFLDSVILTRWHGDSSSEDTIKVWGTLVSLVRWLLKMETR